MALLLPAIAIVLSLWLLIAQSSPRQPTETTDIFNYGEIDKTCMQWTDGCRNCSRGTGQMPNCSNIGIACQPKDKVTCLDRTPPDGAKDSIKPDDAKR